jgi:hypothetical protein
LLQNIPLRIFDPKLFSRSFFYTYNHPGDLIHLKYAEFIFSNSKYHANHNTTSKSPYFEQNSKLSQKLIRLIGGAVVVN